MHFKDKVIWITGASSGIGEHLAYAFAQQGAKLVLSARNGKELERVRNNCGEEADILILPLDIADFQAIPSAAEQVIRRYGWINILVNNAGISQRALAKDTLLEVDQKIMTVNYLGTVALTKAVLPCMLRQKFGHIVVISSVLGKYGVGFRSAYSASKHALHGFFESLRTEVWEDNIKVTIICPGYVRTNVTINALKGDGSAHNVMAESTNEGMDPSVFAQKALRGIAREQMEIYVGGKEILGIYLHRFVPGLFARIIKNVRLR